MSNYEYKLFKEAEFYGMTFYYTSWNCPLNHRVFNAGFRPFYIDEERDIICWPEDTHNALQFQELLYNIEEGRKNKERS